MLRSSFWLRPRGLEHQQNCNSKRAAPMKYSIVAAMRRLARIPVLVRYVPDHDGGPRVHLLSRRRRRVGVASGLGLLEQEARLPPALPSFPIPAAAPGTFLGLLPSRRRGRRGRRRRHDLVVTLALALIARAALGLIACAGLRGAPPQKHHSFPRPHGARRRRRGRRLGRSQRRLMPRRSRRAGPVVGHVPAPTTDRHTAEFQPPTG